MTSSSRQHAAAMLKGDTTGSSQELARCLAALLQNMPCARLPCGCAWPANAATWAITIWNRMPCNWQRSTTGRAWELSRDCRTNPCNLSVACMNTRRSATITPPVATSRNVTDPRARPIPPQKRSNDQGSLKPAGAFRRETSRDRYIRLPRTRSLVHNACRLRMF